MMHIQTEGVTHCDLSKICQVVQLSNVDSRLIPRVFKQSSLFVFLCIFPNVDHFRRIILRLDCGIKTENVVVLCVL